jgi:hypothetical protein
MTFAPQRMTHNLGHLFIVFEQHDVGHGTPYVGRRTITGFSLSCGL